MIYTASYFEPHRHHGKRLSISRSIPAGFQVEGHLEFLIPSADLLQAWKAKRINETEYTNRYREQIKMNLPIIKHWLANLDSEEDMTLLCWESSAINKEYPVMEVSEEGSEVNVLDENNQAIELLTADLSLVKKAELEQEENFAHVTEAFSNGNSPDWAIGNLVRIQSNRYKNQYNGQTGAIATQPSNFGLKVDLGGETPIFFLKDEVTLFD